MWLSILIVSPIDCPPIDHPYPVTICEGGMKPLAKRQANPQSQTPKYRPVGCCCPPWSRVVWRSEVAKVVGYKPVSLRASRLHNNIHCISYGPHQNTCMYARTWALHAYSTLPTCIRIQCKLLQCSYNVIFVSLDYTYTTLCASN